MSQTIFTLDSVPDSKLTTVRWGKGVSSEPLEKFQEDNKPSTSKAGQDGWVWTMGNQPRREKSRRSSSTRCLDSSRSFVTSSRAGASDHKERQEQSSKGCPNQERKKVSPETEQNTFTDQVWVWRKLA